MYAFLRSPAKATCCTCRIFLLFLKPPCHGGSGLGSTEGNNIFSKTPSDWQSFLVSAQGICRGYPPRRRWERLRKPYHPCPGLHRLKHASLLSLMAFSQSGFLHRQRIYLHAIDFPNLWIRQLSYRREARLFFFQRTYIEIRFAKSRFDSYIFSEGQFITSPQRDESLMFFSVSVCKYTNFFSNFQNFSVLLIKFCFCHRTFGFRYCANRFLCKYTNFFLKSNRNFQKSQHFAQNLC